MNLKIILVILIFNNKKIIELNDNNFKKLNNIYPYLFIMAYETDCDVFKKFEKKYTKYAKKTNKNNKKENIEYRIARINITNNPEFKKNYNIKGSPVFIFMVKEIAIPYHHDIKISSIKFFLELQFHKFIYDLPKSKPQYNIENYKNKIMYCLYDDSNKDFETLLRIVNRSLDIHLIIYKLSKKGDCYKFKMNNGELYYTKSGYPEKYNGDKTNFEEIRNFSIFAIFDVHNVYSESLIKRAVERNLSILIIHNIEEKVDSLIKELYKDHIKHRYIVFNTNGFQDEKFLFHEFGILPKDKFILLFDSLNYIKYKFEKEVNKENLTVFLDEHKKELLEPYYKSESLPKETNHLLKRLVGLNYHEFINNTQVESKVVLIWYHDVSHEESIKLKNLYIDLLKTFNKKKEIFTSINFGIINLLKNDIKGIEHSPIIYCIHKGNQYEYTKHLDKIEIIKFIENCGKIDINSIFNFYEVNDEL